MTVDQSLAFLVFAIVAAVTPGPSNVMITATGSAVGVARGLPCVLGAAVGMGSLLFSAALGLGQLVLAYPLLTKLMNGLGAMLLLWLAWKIATAGPARTSGAAKPVGFLGAALFQWVNPKGWLVAVSAAGTYLQATADRPLIEATVIGLLVVLAAIPSGLLWLALGALLQRYLGNERRARAFNIGMALALAGSILLILF